MSELRQKIWGNRWVRFGVVSVLYILWFVVWTRNLWWLLGVVVIYDIYIGKRMDRLFLNRYRDFKANHARFRKTAEWVEALLFAIVVVVPLKLYFFGMYVIPSSSMEHTLLTGDYIFVSKVHYGPKMPNTPISFPFVQNIMPFTKTVSSYVDWFESPYKRLRGFDTVRNHDVVVFNFPEGDTVALGTLDVTDEYGRTIETDVSTTDYYELVRAMGRDEVYGRLKVVYRPVDKRENYIKRCIAVAGQTVQIKEGRVFVNGRSSRDDIPGLQYLYLVNVSGPIGRNKTFERLEINEEEVGYNPEAKRYTMPLTERGVKQIKKLPEVKQVMRYINRVPNESIFPHDPRRYPWTEDNFGPLWVPRRGATVELTEENLPLYERIIRNYEGNRLRVDESNGNIYINDSLATDYTFRMNYYFMMGDNRHNSADSRFWGFVPEDHIEGKASFVWLSIAPGKNLFNGIRWNRMFRKID